MMRRCSQSVGLDCIRIVGNPICFLYPCPIWQVPLGENVISLPDRCPFTFLLSTSNDHRLLYWQATECNCFIFGFEERKIWCLPSGYHWCIRRGVLMWIHCLDRMFVGTVDEIKNTHIWSVLMRREQQKCLHFLFDKQGGCESTIYLHGCFLHSILISIQKWIAMHYIYCGAVEKQSYAWIAKQATSSDHSFSLFPLWFRGNDAGKALPYLLREQQVYNTLTLL